MDLYDATEIIAESLYNAEKRMEKLLDSEGLNLIKESLTL